MTVTLQSANGTLSFSQLPTSVAVTGNGTSEIQLTGTIGDINLLLSQGVLFQSAEGFSGETSVNVTIQDGLGGSGDLSATASVTLTIIAAPDPPPPPMPPPPPVSFQDRILELSGKRRIGSPGRADLAARSGASGSRSA